MLVVFTKEITNRLQYIFDLILKDLCGIDYSIVTSFDEFEKISGPKFSYNETQLGDELFIESTDLLFNKNIEHQNIDVSDFNGLKIFYGTTSQSVIPFDLFAASFFLVSRYEEYLNYQPDKYGRFEAGLSFAYKNNFLKIPVVNSYALLLKSELQKHFSDLAFKENKYEYKISIDVDNAYAFSYKGFVRTTGAMLRSLFKFDFKGLKQRVQTIAGLVPDAFDTYDYIAQFASENQINLLYFFLLGNFERHDRNVSYKNKNFRSLIKSISSYAEVGIHPSYNSNKKPKMLDIEKYRLEEIVSLPVTKSRQHFLRLKFPETYRNLISAGISDDYTMGYAEQIGFRAGICSPFYFYDLKADQQTKLRIHPFAIMDATLNRYMKCSPQEAELQAQLMIAEIKKVNGTFISLWHNETLSETGEWIDWRKVFESLIN